MAVILDGNRTAIKEDKTRNGATSTEHGNLIKSAKKWLAGTCGCGFVFTELRSYSMEIPDAIGFRNHGSILVECKVTRNDFLSDRNKLFRQYPEMGLGMYRFYMCPEGVIEAKDLPERWGLIWVKENDKLRVIHGPKGNIWSSRSRADFRFPERDMHGEWQLMYSALRRLNLRGDLPKIYDQEWEKKRG